MFEFEKLVPCRGDTTPRINKRMYWANLSPLQYDFHNLWLLMPDDCPIGRLNHNAFTDSRLGRAK